MHQNVRISIIETSIRRNDGSSEDACTAVTAHRKPSSNYGKPLVQRFSGKFARKSLLDKDEQILRALFTRGERLPMARARPSITNLRFRRMPAGKRVHDAPNGQSERKQSSQPTIVTIKQKKVRKICVNAQWSGTKRCARCFRWERIERYEGKEGAFRFISARRMPRRVSINSRRGANSCRWNARAEAEERSR